MTNETKNLKIDLVYMWVDGKDPAWIKKKSMYDEKLATLSKEVVSECRYFDNEELRFSLRSVEKYAPWINHIYIITDNQVPVWLNTKHEKITIIDHSQIMPSEVLPCFSSPALECGLANIPNLSEHFIYQNDDMLFFQPVSPDFFFTPSGDPIVRLRRRTLLYYRLKKHSNYAFRVYRTIQRIQNDYGTCYPMSPHHCADAYRKSTFLACLAKYKSLVDETLAHRFREQNDIQRSLMSLYALETKQAALHWVHKFNRTNGFWAKLRSFITGNYTYDSVHLHINTKDYSRALKRTNPVLLCLNDSHRSTNADRVRAHAFLQQTFPVPSAFEVNA